MIKQLTRTGNSHTLVINKEMQRHLGLTEPKVVVEYHAGCIILRAPAQPQTFDEALHDTLEQYSSAFEELAKLE